VTLQGFAYKAKRVVERVVEERIANPWANEIHTPGRVVSRSKELLEERGPGAFGFYNSGQLFLEDCYTVAVMTRGGLGTPHVDGNTRLCTATAGAALNALADRYESATTVGSFAAETETGGARN
jgi:anaerobic selenocysteine-containing dehydrogenase